MPLQNDYYEKISHSSCFSLPLFLIVKDPFNSPPEIYAERLKLFREEKLRQNANAMLGCLEPMRGSLSQMRYFPSGNGE